MHVVLALGPRFYTKARGWPFQLSVLCLGLSLRLLRDLWRLFDGDALYAELHIEHPPGGAGPMAFELEIARLLLADEVRHGRMVVRLEALHLLAPEIVGIVSAPEDAIGRPDGLACLRDELLRRIAGLWAGTVSSLATPP